jgi:TP901 family phage tail tape measure protein/lambda family phage tail tape measure protein
MAKKSGGNDKNLSLGISLDTSDATSALSTLKGALSSIGQQSASFDKVHVAVKQLGDTFAGMASMVSSVGDMKGTISNLLAVTENLNRTLATSVEKVRAEVSGVAKEQEKLALLDAKYQAKGPKEQLKVLELIRKEFANTKNLDISVKLHGLVAAQEAMRTLTEGPDNREAVKNVEYKNAALKKRIELLTTINNLLAEGASIESMQREHGTSAVSDAQSGKSVELAKELFAEEQQILHLLELQNAQREEEAAALAARKAKIKETQEAYAQLDKDHAEALQRNAQFDREANANANKNYEYQEASLKRRSALLAEINGRLAEGVTLESLIGKHGTSAVSDAQSGKAVELAKELLAEEQQILSTLRLQYQERDAEKNYDYGVLQLRKKAALLDEISGKLKAGVGAEKLIDKHGTSAVLDAQNGKSAEIAKEIVAHELAVTKEQEKQLILRKQNEEHQARLNKFLAEGLATTKNTSAATAALGSHMHDANRGFTAGLGAIWLSWGSMLPIMAGFAASASLKRLITEGSELESTLSKVRSVTDEKVRPSMAALTKDVLALSKTSQNGPQELAKGLNALAQAGIEAREGLRNMPVVDKLATVGEMDTGKAAEFLAGLQSAFGGPMKNTFEGIGNVMAQVAADSQTTLPEISEAMKQASTVAEQYGVSITDVGVALESMAKNNVRGSAAGTAFRNMMEDITGRSEKSRKAFDALNFSFFTATGEMKPLGQGIAELRDKLEGASPKARDMALKLIGSERGLKSLIPLLAMGAEGYDKLSASLEKAKSGTALNDMFTIQTDNLKGDWEKTVNAFTSVMHNAFVSSSDDLRKFVTSLGAAFQSEDFAKFVKAVGTGLGEVGKLLLMVVDNAKLILNVFEIWGAFKLYGLIGQIGLAAASMVTLKREAFLTSIEMNKLGSASLLGRIGLIARALVGIPGIIIAVGAGFYGLTSVISNVADKGAHKIGALADSVRSLSKELAQLMRDGDIADAETRSRIKAVATQASANNNNKTALEVRHFLTNNFSSRDMTPDMIKSIESTGNLQPIFDKMGTRVKPDYKVSMSRQFESIYATYAKNKKDYDDALRKANQADQTGRGDSHLEKEPDAPGKPYKSTPDLNPGKTSKQQDATSAMAEEVKRLASIQLDAEKQRLTLQEDIVKLQEEEFGYAQKEALEALKVQKLSVLDKQAAEDKAKINKEIAAIDERNKATMTRGLHMTADQLNQDQEIKKVLKGQLTLVEDILAKKKVQVGVETVLAEKQAQIKKDLADMLSGKTAFDNARFKGLVNDDQKPKKDIADQVAGINSVNEAIEQLNETADQVGWTSSQKQLADWAKKLQKAGVSSEIAKLKLGELRDSLDKLDASKANPMSGYIAALEEYKAKIEDVAGAAKGVLGKALQGTEDALVSLATTGKMSFKDLANSILQDMMRVAIQQTIMKPITGWLIGMFRGLGGDSGGSSGGGLGAMVGSVLGGGSAKGNMFGTASRFAAGGAFSNSIVSSPTNFRFADGGAFKLGLMGEAGPEAVMPLVRDKAGRLGVRGQDGGGQAPQSVQTINVTHAPVFNIDSRSDRAQVEQIARSAAAQGNAQLVDTLKRQRVI